MTSPEYNGTGNTGYGSGTGDAARAGTETGSPNTSGRTDDVSFARSIGADQSSDATTDKAKNAVERGVSSAQDAMSQLQAKATELTTNMLDRVNVDDLTQKLEEQVRTHPTRTLLMAMGAGFLLGRTAKK